MDLLAAEMLAVTGKDPAQLYGELTARLGEPVYERIDAPATRAQKAALQKFSPHQVQSRELGGRTDHRPVDRSTRKQGINRWTQGHHGERLVCRAPERNRRCLQTVCGKFQRPGSSSTNSGRCASLDPASLLQRRGLILPPRPTIFRTRYTSTSMPTLFRTLSNLVLTATLTACAAPSSQSDRSTVSPIPDCCRANPPDTRQQAIVRTAVTWSAQKPLKAMAGTSPMIAPE